MPDEQHFFFSEGAMCGHANDETLARVSEGAYVIFQLHESSVSATPAFDQAP